MGLSFTKDPIRRIVDLGRGKCLACNPQKSQDPSPVCGEDGKQSFTLKAGKHDESSTASNLLPTDFNLLNEVLYRLLYPSPEAPSLSTRGIRRVCELAIDTLKQELNHSRLVTLGLKRTHVFGDIHGHFSDLILWISRLEVLDTSEKPGPSTTGAADTQRRVRLRPGADLLFLGDYVDRGTQSLETVIFLFCLLVLFPGQVTMLRGNHEDRRINGKNSPPRISLLTELQERLHRRSEVAEVFNSINEVFSYLPPAAIIGGRIWCAHGGLAKQLQSPQQVNEQPWPLKDPWQSPLIYDLLWSDPADRQWTAQGWLHCQPPLNGWHSTGRGSSLNGYGPDVVEAFLEANDLDLVIRAHQDFPEGYFWHQGYNNRVLTVFSAADYMSCGNSGTVLTVEPYVGDTSTAGSTVNGSPVTKLSSFTLRRMEVCASFPATSDACKTLCDQDDLDDSARSGELNSAPDHRGASLDHCASHVGEPGSAPAHSMTATQQGAVSHATRQSTGWERTRSVEVARSDTASALGSPGAAARFSEACPGASERCDSDCIANVRIEKAYNKGQAGPETSVRTAPSASDGPQSWPLGSPGRRHACESNTSSSFKEAWLEAEAAPPASPETTGGGQRESTRANAGGRCGLGKGCDSAKSDARMRRVMLEVRTAQGQDERVVASADGRSAAYSLRMHSMAPRGPRPCLDWQGEGSEDAEGIDSILLDMQATEGQ